MQNIQRLICPISKKWQGTPFAPITAIPVDMFPHTDHCEMIVTLVRDKYNPNQKNNTPAAASSSHHQPLAVQPPFAIRMIDAPVQHPVSATDAADNNTVITSSVKTAE
jgi:hypothetical protein